MISYLHLPIHFDSLRMQEEVTALADPQWKEHYNKSQYKGDWSVIALHAVDGIAGNIYSIHASAAGAKMSRYKNTIFMEQCPYLQTVMDYFQCEKTTVRLMKLNAGAVILPHQDTDMNFEAGEVRFHIPIQTNEQVAFYIEEERIPMKAGECWYLNLSQTHRVSNNGTIDRVHLVLDGIVNDWVKELFTGPVLKKKETFAQPAGKNHSKEDKLKIIDALRRLNTSVSNEMAHKMELENE